MKLTAEGLMVTELAPGIDLRRDVLERAETPLKIAPNLKLMDAALFHPEKVGLHPTWEAA